MTYNIMIYTLKNIVISEGFDVNRIDLELLGTAIKKYIPYNWSKRPKKINVNKNGQLVKVYLYDKLKAESVIKYLHKIGDAIYHLANQTMCYDRKSYYFNKFKI